MYAIIQSAGHQFKVTPGGFATIAGTAGEPGAERGVVPGQIDEEERRALVVEIVRDEQDALGERGGRYPFTVAGCCRPGVCPGNSTLRRIPGQRCAEIEVSFDTGELGAHLVVCNHGDAALGHGCLQGREACGEACLVLLWMRRLLVLVGEKPAALDGAQVRLPSASSA